MKKISMAKTTQEKALKDGYKEFTTYCKVKNLSEKTIEYYETYMDKFENYLNSCNVTLIKDINLHTINNFILYLKSIGNRNDISINTAIRAIRAIVYYFQGLGYCQPFKINIIKADKQIKMTYTEHELKLLLEKPKATQFSDYRSWVTVNFLLATGVRVGELCNIKVKDVNLHEAVVSVNGKSRHERFVPLSRTIIKILTEYIEIRQCSTLDDYLFCNSYGQRLSEDSCKHAILKYNRNKGVFKTSIHLFRHTFAKMYILNGGDVFRLQKILGHKSIEIVKEYVNMFSNDLKKDFDDFNPLETINKGKGNFIDLKKSAISNKVR